MTENFDDFYRDTSRRLLRYACGLTGDPAEAQRGSAGLRRVRVDPGAAGLPDRHRLRVWSFTG